MAKCKHETVSITWDPDTGKEVSRRCSATFGCGAQIALGTTPDPAPGSPELLDVSLTRIHRSGEVDLTTDDGWPWDITRPVVRQHEEWLAAESERMRESIEDHIDTETRIAEQTRHDVAASVARHADVDARAAARDLSPAAIAHALVRAQQVADAELIALCEEALREPGGGAAGQLAEHIAYNPDLAKWMAAYAQRRADDAAAEQGVEFPVEVGSDEPDEALLDEATLLGAISRIPGP